MRQLSSGRRQARGCGDVAPTKALRALHKLVGVLGALAVQGAPLSGAAAHVTWWRRRSKGGGSGQATEGYSTRGRRVFATWARSEPRQRVLVKRGEGGHMGWRRSLRTRGTGCPRG